MLASGEFPNAVSVAGAIVPDLPLEESAPMLHAPDSTRERQPRGTAGPPADTRVTTMSVDELSPGDVVVRVAYSSLNYKDARAVTGRGLALKGRR